MNLLSTSISDEVLLAVGLPAHCKLLYLMFRWESKKSGNRCYLTRARMQELTGLSKETIIADVKRLIKEGLVVPQGRAEWLVIDPSEKGWLHLVEVVKKRLREAPSHGQGLALEYCTLWVDCDEFQDNARPAFEVSPETGKLYELDRWYANLKVAIEYQGLQHYGPTRLYPNREEARRLRMHDLVKRALAEEVGVHIIAVHRQDLSLQGMKELLEPWLPLRQGVEGSPVALFLEREAQAYRESFTERWADQ